MHPVIALGLVMVAGAAAMRLPRWPTLPRRLDLVRAAATPLLLLGLFLGQGSGVLDAATLRLLAPVTALGIGWIGASFGARMDRRWLRRLPRRVWLVAALDSLITFLAVTGAAALLARAVPALAPLAGWRTAILLGAIAVIAAPALVARAARAGALGPREARMLRASTTLETALGMLVASVVFGGAGRFDGVLGAAAGILGGVALGVLLVGLGRFLAREDLGVPLPGTVLVAAGLGYALGVSPFLVCAFATMTAARLSPRRRDLARRLGGWERALVAVLLILVGARLGLPTVWLLPAALVLAVVRLGARWAPVLARRRLALPWWPRAVWAAQTQGPLAIAFAASVPLTRSGTAAEMIFTITVVSVALSQFAAAPGMARAPHAREL